MGGINCRSVIKGWGVGGAHDIITYTSESSRTLRQRDIPIQEEPAWDENRKCIIKGVGRGRSL